MNDGCVSFVQLELKVKYLGPVVNHFTVGLQDKLDVAVECRLRHIWISGSLCADKLHLAIIQSYHEPSLRVGEISRGSLVLTERLQRFLSLGIDSVDIQRTLGVGHRSGLG